MMIEEQKRLVEATYRHHFPNLDPAVIRECAEITVAARLSFTAQIIPFRRPPCTDLTA